MIAGHRVAESERIAEILEVVGEPPDERYRVRAWDDGHESVYYPGSDARSSPDAPARPVAGSGPAVASRRAVLPDRAARAPIESLSDASSPSPDDSARARNYGRHSKSVTTSTHQGGSGDESYAAVGGADKERATAYRAGIYKEPTPSAGHHEPAR